MNISLNVKVYFQHDVTIQDIQTVGFVEFYSFFPVNEL